MKKPVLLAFLLSLPLWAGQPNCSTVSDEAGVINGYYDLMKSANLLADQGVDVHVVTIANMSVYGPRLIDAEKAYEGHCPSWMASPGVRKANLLVLMVAPKDRVKNAFFGSAYSPVFGNEDTVNSIYSSAANPYFRTKQWSEGLSATLKDFGGKIFAYHDQQKHPVVSSTVVNQQATDFRGLWAFLKILAFIGTFVLAFFLITWILRRRRELSAARAGAIAAREDAASAFLILQPDSPDYGNLASRYQSMSSRAEFDPDEGLDKEQYDSITSKWSQLHRDIQASVSAARRKTTIAENPKPATEAPTPRVERVKTHSHHSTKSHSQLPSASDSAITSPSAVPVHQTVVVQSSTPTPSGGFTEGLVLGELLAGRTEQETHHRHESYESPIPSWSSSSSSSDSGSSGSDSGWGSSSSSSDSSSSSSSGSDSSWGSSSSDSSSSWSSSDSGSSFGSGSDSSW